MYGAILGDIIGSPYEFDFRNIKTKDFPLFSGGSVFTDDSVMTIAVVDGILNSLDENNHFDDDVLRENIIDSLKLWGERFPNAGYGTRFYAWLFSDNKEPYNSYGNGSAMRVSSAGWLFDDIETTRRAAKISAEVTHNHPEGIKGAEATASAIFLARTGSTKDEIKDYIIKEFGYDLSRTCEEIRPTYRHIESCQETVPEAITAFLEGDSFEDVIRTAVSLGGDSDTLTCIAGGIAEAYYGVPAEIMMELVGRLPESFVKVLDRFDGLKWQDRLPAPTDCTEYGLLSDFYKKDDNRKVWWIDALEQKGPLLFSFDRKKIYNYWRDYPSNLTPEEVKIFQEDEPYWANFRRTKMEE